MSKKTLVYVALIAVGVYCLMELTPIGEKIKGIVTGMSTVKTPVNTDTTSGV